MVVKNFIYLLIVSVLLFGCHSKSILKQRKAETEMDSVLFYQQKDISDPFIDAVLTHPGDEAVLKTTLIPPPPLTPKFKQIEGFRVQIFAGLDSLNALTNKYQAASIVDDSTYLFFEKGLFKVQVGDFPYRPEADRMKIVLKENGFTGAWVIKRLINVPVDTTSGEPQIITSPNESGAAQDAPFRIQIMAVSDEAKALDIVEELQRKFEYQSYYKKTESLYKIYLGKFKNRDEAERALNKVREKGYNDAWLVY